MNQNNLPNPKATWNATQWQSAGRNWLSTAAGVVGSLVAMALTLHAITPEQASDLTKYFNELVSGITLVVEAVIGLATVVLIPIYTSFKAAHSASPNQQAKSLTSLPNDQVAAALESTTNGSRVKLISGVADMTGVRGIIGPENLAAATESPKVVSTVAEMAALPLAQVIPMPNKGEHT